ncbi:protein SPMIP2 [Gastrophryne carolinensis]
MHQKEPSRPSTSLSCRPQYAPGKRMLYTGPDYVRNYRPRLPDFTRYVGESMPSLESTSDVDYVCRAAPGTPAPLPKDCYIGGIGWGVSEFRYLNTSQLCSNYQIKMRDFRRACEDKVTHQYQNPWHPSPHILDREGPGSRAKLAWLQDRYENYNYSTREQWPLLLDRSKTPTPVPSYLQQDQKRVASYSNLKNKYPSKGILHNLALNAVSPCQVLALLNKTAALVLALTASADASSRKEIAQASRILAMHFEAKVGLKVNAAASQALLKIPSVR